MNLFVLVVLAYCYSKQFIHGEFNNGFNNEFTNILIMNLIIKQLLCCYDDPVAFTDCDRPNMSMSLFWNGLWENALYIVYNMYELIFLGL